MVGVPGRSKACATCRRRKKGCDFQRPSCTQCQRAGLECGGYERGRIFVHTTQNRPSASTLVSVRDNALSSDNVRVSSSTVATSGTSAASVASVASVASGTNGSSLVRARSIPAHPPGHDGNANSTVGSCGTIVQGPAPSFQTGVYEYAGAASNAYNSAYIGEFSGAPANAPNAPATAIYTTGTTSGTRPSVHNDRDNGRDNDRDSTGRPPPVRGGPQADSGTRAFQHITPAQLAAGLLGTPRADGSLLGTAREDLLLAAFWQSYLPNSSVFPSQAVGFASGGWTNVVQDLYRKDPVLHYALIANCFSAAARIGDSRYMAEQSLRAHGRALYELRLALNHPQKARSDSVFSALRLMIVFSMFFSDRYEEDRKARARGWKEHNAGVLALLRARGPEAHMDGHGHQMFVDCRLALIITSIRLKKRSPLNSQQWLTIPWTHIPKTPKDTLIDIMSGLPTILEYVDKLEKMPPHDMGRFTYRAKVIDICWSYDHLFCSWFENNIPKDRLQEVEASIIYNPNFTDNDALTTEDLAIVYIMSVYLSGCVLLYHTMHSIHIPDLPNRANVSMYMNKIVAYLKVGFHPSAGQYGLEMTSFPLGLCLQILFSDSPTGDNVEQDRETFTRLLENARGRDIRDFLRSMLSTG